MEHTKWYKKAIIYQIYPRSFKDTNNDGIGDIPGIISKLDYLKDLGITAIWLSPVYDSPQYDNGYDIADYRNIWKPFGNLLDMKNLIHEAHKRDIKIIMDLVVNHTSNEHKWFKEAISNKDSKYRDYYIIRKGRKNGKKPPNNWDSMFGGSAWERIGESEDYYLHLFAKQQPDLNWENPRLRDEIIALLRFWLDLGVDGFRCDVITLISKDPCLKNDYSTPILHGKKYYINGPHLHEYLKLLYEKAYKDYDVVTIGETLMSSPKEVLELVNPNNNELDMVFNFSHTDSDNYLGVKYFYRKFNLNRFKSRLTKYQNLLSNGKGWNTLFIENHDQRRSAGRFGTDLKEHRITSTKSLATAYFFLCGTPFIYQGQEIGMQNIDATSDEDFKDVETINTIKQCKKSKIYNFFFGKHIYEVSRDNARTPMQWDDSYYAGFSNVSPWIKVNKNKSYINVKTSLNETDSILNYYKKLISIRKKYETLMLNGKYKLLCKRNKKLFVYSREDEKQQMIIIASFANKRTTNPLKKHINQYELILSNECENNKDILKPYEARIYFRNKIQ